MAEPPKGPPKQRRRLRELDPPPSDTPPPEVARETLAIPKNYSTMTPELLVEGGIPNAEGVDRSSLRLTRSSDWA
jgi:hypothetical protein